MKYTLLLAALWCVLSAATARAADDWQPVGADLLGQNEPLVEKEADAEAIFWQVRLDDENNGDPRSVLSHYIRVKIFNERGAEAQGKVDIPYWNNMSIKDVNARTIKSDGTIIELKKDAVFERTLIRASGIKVKAKSFALSGVEPGAIVEYRWRELRPTLWYTRLQLQRDIPIRTLKYLIKPMQNSPYSLRSITFHSRPAPFTKEKQGFYSVTLSNVPAFREEPRMPPEDQVRAWMLVYYSEDRKLTPDKYWKDYGKRVYEENKSAMKAGDDVRRVAAEVTAGAATPEEKLQKLFDYCRTNIRNAYDDVSGLSAEEREKFKESKSPEETIKRGLGTARDIDRLFAALAVAAGFEARVTALSDRSDIFFDPNLADDYFLSTFNIAVKVGGEWRFFDPASAYVPFGMLRWQEEGQQALISDPKEPFFLRTPLSPSAKSRQRRVANLRLSEDGTLEGTVQVEYTGHFAAEYKELADDDSPAEREQFLRDQLKSRLGGGEISDVKIENVADPTKPYTYSYRLQTPGYAQRTGKRLFVQPAFFQQGVGNLFSTTARRHSVYFHHPWSEEDLVNITLPASYSLDNAEAPASFKLGELGDYSVKLGVTKDQRTLQYRRQFTFDGMLFPAENYAQLKKVFDTVHEQDGHTITLKQDAAK